MANLLQFSECSHGHVAPITAIVVMLVLALFGPGASTLRAINCLSDSQCYADVGPRAGPSHVVTLLGVQAYVIGGLCGVIAYTGASIVMRERPLNIVHRDVSPQNIFVTYDGSVKVLDFGIAKASNVIGQTKTGIIKGRIAYMPREQLLNEELDRRADIYAVGCVLWQAAAGARLWSELTEGDVMRALIEGKIPKPSERRPVAQPRAGYSKGE